MDCMGHMQLKNVSVFSAKQYPKAFQILLFNFPLEKSMINFASVTVRRKNASLSGKTGMSLWLLEKCVCRVATPFFEGFRTPLFSG